MSVGIQFYIDRLPSGVGSKYEYFIYINIALMLGIATVLEMFYQWVKKKEEPLYYPY